MLRFAATNASRKYIGTCTLCLLMVCTHNSLSTSNIQSDQGVHNEVPCAKDGVSISTVDLDELSKHNRDGDCWVSIHGRVYDVSEFVQQHPGGSDKLLRFAGKDATRGFRLQHPESYLERFLGDQKYRGRLVDAIETRRVASKKGISLPAESSLERYRGASDDEREYYKALVREYMREYKRRRREKESK
ncbi:uncharacterized protein C5L36_0B09360 [Pichia kudriavzevii]|uniref:Cytochrome b2, mitochondrial n=1 Tax=Pichia kudriavzevii TaxID=4909 RepID=A0A1V2LU35_PICKU|nr:uncharacterized protein C5L36_0B09360 [Pichia kudriavzevii]AWU75695.1 hypothetical protein C5L36_0B09360 [Pichia kudriavzevii]ONH77345.1 Cytochrome b2, mitochondrial [Pichia kudriavzevii]